MHLQRLNEAQRLFEEGQYNEAARIFERLAAGAVQRGMLNRGQICLRAPRNAIWKRLLFTEYLDQHSGQAKDAPRSNEHAHPGDLALIHDGFQSCGFRRHLQHCQRLNR